ncbi:class I adenylate-forming enzyme family protein [Azoarcus sp. KH32C]|uniref:class I adenylate-forming enzyme family protein n=1 Tax=Azoarcus sp. KH32C TaxID=748247 RepID=UPI0002386CBE|nr:AMP-binding protein [Azoarcus sp. KH32C]BAL25469.1 AMP-dependent synthetase and ligase [Azoarcus sp. KH32C]
MNIAELLVRTARSFPDRTAVLRGTTALHDYAEFAARCARLAHHLRNDHHLEAGDRVTLYMSNRPEYLESLYATLWAGLVAVPVNAKLHPREILHILADSESRVAIVSPELADELLPVLHEVGKRTHVIVAGDAHYAKAVAGRPLAPVPRAPTDLAWLFYTSGTTGRPKGVMLTHRNLLTMTHGYFSDVESLDGSEAAVYAAPMSHGAGLYNFAFTLRGCRHVVPASGGFDAQELVELSRDVGNLSMFAAPTMVKRLVAHLRSTEARPDGFKTIVYGGGPMYLEDIRDALDTLGNRFVQIYGQGESPMSITVLPRELLADRTNPAWEAHAASVGICQSSVEVIVADADGHPVRPGETGEVLVRGDTVMAGYWNNPAATDKTLRHGWLWTGDLGSMDTHGFLTLKDRSKDVIISGGSNIYPREVEEVLIRHPDVMEVSVVGRPDSEWGEIPVAFIVGRGVTASDLDALCLHEIARFKRPREYHFVEALPKNNYGKILKTTLREMLKTLPSGPASTNG